MIIVWITQEVPDEDILKESRRFETMLKDLLQSPDESVLPTEQKGQTASLWNATAKRTRRSWLPIKGHKIMEIVFISPQSSCHIKSEEYTFIYIYKQCNKVNRF